MRATRMWRSRVQKEPKEFHSFLGDTWSFHKKCLRQEGQDVCSLQMVIIVGRILVPSNIHPQGIQDGGIIWEESVQRSLAVIPGQTALNSGELQVLRQLLFIMDFRSTSTVLGLLGPNMFIYW